MRRVSDDTPLDLACGGGGTINARQVFLREHHCEQCEQTSYVDTELKGLPDPCETCGALRRRVSDEAVCLADLL